MTHPPFTLYPSSRASALTIMLWLLAAARLSALDATWNSANDVPLSASGYSATGQTLNASLNYAPAFDDELAVIDNTGTNLISGTFQNLGRGEVIGLPFGGTNYYFIANYFGGDGNDLVLRRIANTIIAWGAGGQGQCGASFRQSSFLGIHVTVASDTFTDPIIAVAAGGQHTLALRYDGRVLTWGSNLAGQLGLGTVVELENEPQLVPNATGALAGKTVTAIAAGGFHSLAMCTDGTVAAWGYNGDGQLGDGSTYDRFHPTTVNRTQGQSALFGRRVIAIAAGRTASLALCSDGSLVYWGRGQQIPTLVSDSPGVPVLAGRTVKSIAVGTEHYLALCTDGSVVAWGRNDHGQLGNGTTTHSSPVLVSTAAGESALYGKTVKSISAGGTHSLALCTDGTLVAWGENTFGQVGDASTTNRLQPVEVDRNPATSSLAGREVVAIAGGKTHSVALCTDGSIVTWGNNNKQQLSAPVGGFRSSPGNAEGYFVHHPGRDRWAATSSSSEHNLILALEEPIPKIELTDSANTRLRSVGTPADFGAVDANGGSAEKTFTLRNTGSADLEILGATFSETGAADYAATGLPTSAIPPGGTATFTLTFSPTATGGRFAKLNLERNVFTTPSQMWLHGTGMGAMSATLNAASDAPFVTEGFTATGSTLEVQLNFTPQIGEEVTLLENTSARFIQGEFENLSQGQTLSFSVGDERYDYVVDYFAGTGNDLRLRWKNTRLAAWGSNVFGKLGVGSAVADGGTALVPLSLGNTGALLGRTVIQTAAGASHSLALCSDGVILSWGSNAQGQLGITGTSNRDMPTVVNATGTLGGYRVIAIAAGVDHSLALNANGDVYAWGGNGFGQLGDGTQTSRSGLGSVSGLGSFPKVVGITAGAFFSVALLDDGTTVGWGKNHLGQLGIGIYSTLQLTPAAFPVRQIGNLRNILKVSAGDNHCLGLSNDGRAVTWGSSLHGQLGSTYYLQGTPVVSYVSHAEGISALFGRTVTDIAAGGNASFALCQDGALASWGAGVSSGNGATADQPLPALVNQTEGESALAGKGIAQLSAGSDYAAAVMSDGTVAAWGTNDAGQLGDGTQDLRSLPITTDLSSLSSGPRVLQVSANGHSDGTTQPHSLAIIAAPPEPAIAVTDSSSTPVATGTKANSLGRVIIAATQSYQFHISNNGSAPLTGLVVSISGSHPGDYAVDQPSSDPVAVGQSVPFTLHFTPNYWGVLTALIRITTTNPNGPQFEFLVSGTGFTLNTGDLEIRKQPSPQIIAAGSPLNLLVITQGAGPTTYQWQKNGRNISRATLLSYAYSATQLNHSGAYTCKIAGPTSTLTTTKAEIAVVDVIERVILPAAGTTVTLTTVAAGNGLTYQWSQNGSEIEGATGKTLRLGPLATTNSGIYHCTVSAPGGTLNGGRYEVRVVDSAPILTTPSDGVLPPAMVADEYHYQLPIDPAVNRSVARYTASGLPAGLRINASTGLISGTPTVGKATPYTIKVSAANSRFTTRATLYLTVNPLPGSVIGTYTCIVPRTYTTQLLGGRIDLTTTKTGTFSGKLSLCTGTYPFKGKLDSDLATPSTVAGACEIVRKGSSPMPFSFQLDSTTNQLVAGTLQGNTPTEFSGWRNIWSRSSAPTPFLGYHTFQIRPANSTANAGPTRPQGHGFGSFTVHPTSGTILVVGKLADGTALRTSTFIGPEGQIGIFQSLYRSSYGSLLGVANLAANAPPETASLTGSLTWSCNSTQLPRRLFQSGFGPLNLTINGGLYVAPVAPGIVMALTPGELEQFTALFYADTNYWQSWRADISLPVTIDTRSRMVPLAPESNPAKVTLTFVPKTGTFSGTFQLVAPNPFATDQSLTRNIRYYGLIARDADGKLRGRGWFLLPELPFSAGQTLSTTDLRSGAVNLLP